MDNLSGAPDWGVRREVLDGRLVLAPPPARRHERVVGNLATRFWHALPGGTQVRGGCAVRLADGDGPVPDLVVSGAAPPGEPDPTASPDPTAPPDPPGLPAGEVAAVVEVVSADGRYIDRVWKRERYAEAGIPCYWRVELDPEPGYRGSHPLIVVRLREPTGWREIVAPAGRLHALPLAYRRVPDRVADIVPVRLDPESLLVRLATNW